MSTLDEIAARDEGKAEDDVWLMNEDRRYLLGLVREAEGVVARLYVAALPALGVNDPDARAAADFLTRLTEGSDRT